MTKISEIIDGKKKCSRCGKMKNLKSFHKSIKSATGYASACKQCDNLRNRTAREGDTLHKTKVRDKRLQKDYGITLEDVFNKLKDQDFKCAICSKEINYTYREAAVDHSHSTGKVREILCHRCNLLLGFIEQDLNIIPKVLEYLTKHN